MLPEAAIDVEPTEIQTDARSCWPDLLCSIYGEGGNRIMAAQSICKLTLRNIPGPCSTRIGLASLPENCRSAFRAFAKASDFCFSDLDGIGRTPNTEEARVGGVCGSACRSADLAALSAALVSLAGIRMRGPARRTLPPSPAGRGHG